MIATTLCLLLVGCFCFDVMGDDTVSKRDKLACGLLGAILLAVIIIAVGL